MVRRLKRRGDAGSSCQWTPPRRHAVDCRMARRCWDCRICSCKRDRRGHAALVKGRKMEILVCAEIRVILAAQSLQVPRIRRQSVHHRRRCFPGHRRPPAPASSARGKRLAAPFHAQPLSVHRGQPDETRAHKRQSCRFRRNGGSRGEEGLIGLSPSSGCKNQVIIIAESRRQIFIVDFV